MGRYFHILLLLGAFALLPCSAFAWPPTYGAEFEFSNAKLDAGATGHRIGQAEVDAAKAMAAKIVAKCAANIPPCTMEETRVKKNFAMKVKFSDGWSFTVSTDPGVIEVQTDPLTLEQLKANQKRFDHFIFDSAKEAGFGVSRADSAGHMNVGVGSAFENRGEEFLRYFVDYANHPEFASGLMMNDFLNAPALAALEPKQHAELQKIVDEVKAGKHQTVAEVAAQIKNRVYTKTFTKYEDPFHYQSFSIKRLIGWNPAQGDLPFEHRSVWPQRSAEDFILMAELLEKRMEFLRSPNKPLFTFFTRTHEDFTDQELLDRFYFFCEESGLDWKKYVPLIDEGFAGMEPSTFVRGIIDWSDGDFVAALDSQLNHVPVSKFVREKLRAALMHPESVAGDDGMNALVKLQALMKDASDPEIKKALSEFVQEILNTKLWKEHIPEFLGHVKSKSLSAACELNFKKIAK